MLVEYDAMYSETIAIKTSLKRVSSESIAISSCLKHTWVQASVCKRVLAVSYQWNQPLPEDLSFVLERNKKQERKKCTVLSFKFIYMCW